MRDYSFLFYGALWGLSEIFVWELLGVLGVGSKAPIMATLSLFFMASSSGMRQFLGILTALTAVTVKAAQGLYFPCSVWAVLSLGIAFEFTVFLSKFRRSFKYFVPAFSLPLGMLLFIVVINPSRIVHYALLGGVKAFLGGLIALNGGLLIHEKFKPGLKRAGLVYLASLVIVVFNGLLR